MECQTSKDSTYVMGIDIGTTSAKVVLFTRSGHVASEAEAPYPTSSPKPDYSEQDPLLIEEAIVQSVSEVMKKSRIKSERLLSIGFSAAMHSLICVDDSNRPLSPMITWADRRSIKQVNHYLKEDRSELEKNGTPLHPMSPLFKLLWMKDHAYTPYLNATKFVSIKEFIISRWFNKFVVDYGVASATGLFNVHTLDWNETALNLAGITRDQLSTPVSPTYVCQGLTEEFAQQLGIHRDTPFAVGSSDGPLANIGVGAIKEGDLTLTIGTSGAIRKISSSPARTLKQIFCYSISERHWVLGGPTNNGGNVLQWAIETLCPSNSDTSLTRFENALSLAQTSPPGANSLLFLPYLHGERAPLWRADARGAWLGISSTHTKADFLRSCIEGIVFNLYQISAIVESVTGENKRIYVNGGFARSRFWLQLVADVFGKNLEIPLTHQSAAWGAAWFSLMAIGEEDNLENIANHIPMGDSIYFNQEQHSLYKDLISLFLEAQASQEEIAAKIAAYQIKTP
ncbi:gluconokinase [Alkalihalophilus sp. As8PL]|uniref:Gluconokinase n=1 Tax=Alkalihalophilus sp. As8PL TaxID=3237103 RepID=A0AB39BSZ3_9BACI